MRAIDKHKLEHNIAAFTKIKNSEIQQLVNTLSQLALNLKVHVNSDTLKESCIRLVIFLKQHVPICMNIIILFDVKNTLEVGPITSETVTASLKICKRLKSKNEMATSDLQSLGKIFRFVEECDCIINERPMPSPIAYSSVFDISLQEIIPELIGDNEEAKKMMDKILEYVVCDFGSLRELVLKINEMRGSRSMQLLKKRCGQEFLDLFVFSINFIHIIRTLY